MVRRAAKDVAMEQSSEERTENPEKSGEASFCKEISGQLVVLGVFSLLVCGSLAVATVNQLQIRSVWFDFQNKFD